MTLEGFDYNRTTLTLTCTTSGRPVHSITWLKDGTVVGTVGDTQFRQEQTITDALRATYQHTLIGEDIASLVGSFTCTVGDTDGNSVTRTRRLNGTVTLYSNCTSYHVLYTCRCES